LKGGDIDRIGDDGDFIGRMPRATMSPQAFADGEDVIDLLDGPSFKFAGGTVAQAAFGGGAVVDCRIFPESTNFIDHGMPSLRATLMAGSAFRTGEWA
jgi:hypothetical protein